MVTTLYHGRTGNNMFQYVFARLIAEHNGLEMGTPWPHQNFIKTTPHKRGRTIKTNPVELKDLYYDQHGVDFFSMNLKKSCVKCDGFFQDPKYYDWAEATVRGFFNLEPVQKRPPTDIVMHVRLGDYQDKGLRSVIQPQWYCKILQSMHFNPNKQKLYIVLEEKSHQYLINFLRYRPLVISGTASPEKDFNFIRSFDTILCSNSSFCWWAAFLSDANRIYTFSRWMREPHGAVIRLAYMRRATPILGNWIG